MINRYDEIDFSLIVNKFNKSTNKIGVYIHSPFCPSICKFCIYAGNIIKNKNQYTDYYDKYLPKVIELYRPILENKKDLISNWFFGGGTPSMMSAETLENVINLLPNFKDSTAFKTFEIHPAYWNTDLLDVLEKYKFDNATICLQTFDRTTLISQKRVPADFESVINLSNELKKRNINVFVDIIAFLNRKDSDVDILKNDLELVYNHIYPEEISIQTVYQNKEWTPLCISEVLTSKFISDNQYKIENDNIYKDIQQIDLSILESVNTNNNKCFRLIKKELDIKFQNNLINLTNFMDPQYKTDINLDTIALGSYKNKTTQSHSNISNFNYIEHNSDNITPIFKFIKNTFIEEIRNVLNIMEELGDPSGYFEIKFDNTFAYVNENPVIINFNYSGDDVEYAENLQKLIDIYKSCVDKNIQNK
jgi:hypothetical protein